MSLKILNVRLGHANNSSSSHSILLLPEGAKASDIDEDAPYEFGFGWNHFTMSTPAGKVSYLIANCFYKFKKAFGETYALMILKDLFDMESIGLDPAQLESGEWYVDHQSRLAIPGEFENPRLPNAAFLQDLSTWLQSERVIIIGGNDNDEEQEPPIGGTIEALRHLRHDDSRHSVVARKDHVGNFWTIFNQRTGAKLRLSFGEVSPLALKSSTPELVDLKITNRCPFKCAYCYQSSIPLGSSWKDIYGDGTTDVWSISRVLQDMQVFEVAIGGGEPTLDPIFPRLLEQLNEHGICANFTTRSLRWMKDKALFMRITNYARSFAFSVDTIGDAITFGDTLNETREWARAAGISDQKLLKPSLQLVMGTFPLEDLARYLEIAYTYDLNITLLGYKSVGFGDLIPPQAHDGWIDIIKAIPFGKRPYTIAIDTALAHEYQAQLTAEGVHKISFHVEEGGHSCYVDAITKRVGPSSYHPIEAMHKYEQVHDIPALFQLFPASVPVSYANHPNP